MLYGVFRLGSIIVLNWPPTNPVGNTGRDVRRKGRLRCRRGRIRRRSVKARIGCQQTGSRSLRLPKLLVARLAEEIVVLVLLELDRVHNRAVVFHSGTAVEYRLRIERRLPRETKTGSKVMVLLMIKIRAVVSLSTQDVGEEGHAVGCLHCLPRFGPRGRQVSIERHRLGRFQSVDFVRYGIELVVDHRRSG